MSTERAPFEIDFESHVSQHDIIYEDAPEVWEDGLLIGNGDLGAVVFCPDHIEWIVNKCDIWDDRPNDFPDFTHADFVNALRSGKKPGEALEGAQKERHPRSVKTGATLRLRHPTMRSEGERWEGWKRRMRLKLHAPEVEGECTCSIHRTRLETFVPAQENVLAVRYTGVPTAGGASRVVLELSRAADPHLGAPQFGCDSAHVWLDYSFPTGFRYSVAIAVRRVKSKVPSDRSRRWMRRRYHQPYKSPEFSADADGAKIKIVHDFEAFIAVVTSHEAKDTLKAAVAKADAAARCGARRLRAPHRKWWSGFWSSSFVDLGNDFLECAWYQSLYQVAACSRGRDCPGLFGVFFGDKGDWGFRQPWGGNYTIDVNTTTQHLPVFTSNHLELGKSFFDTFHRMLPLLRRETKRYFGTEGVYYPLTIFPSGADDSDAHFCSYQQCAGPYLALWYWWGYRYSMDKGFLRERAYPVLKAVCDFFTAYMTPGEDGRLRLWPSQAPEMGPVSGTNPALTLSLLKAALRHAIRGAEILGTDRKRRKRWAEVLERFPDYPEKDGIWLESSDLPPDSYVGQFGGQYPIWPAGEVGMGSPADLYSKALRTYRSGERRQTWGVAGDGGGPYPSSGCNWAWYCRTLTAARLGLRDEIEKLLVTDGLKCFLKPNGAFSNFSSALTTTAGVEKALARLQGQKNWDGTRTGMPRTEPYLGWSAGWGESLRRKERMYPILEGSGGYAGIINEMLLQSYGGLLRVFPCVPPNWNVRFGSLRAEGAFLVSSRFTEGKAAFVHIRSLAGESVRLANPWPRKKVKLINAGNLKSYALLAGDILGFQTAAMESYWLIPQGTRLPRTETVSGTPRDTARSLMLEEGYRIWLGKPSRSEYFRDEERKEKSYGES